LKHANDLTGETDTWWTAHERGDSASSGTGIFHIGSTLPIEQDSETSPYKVLRIASSTPGYQVSVATSPAAGRYPGTVAWDSAYGTTGTWSGSGQGYALASPGDYATITIRDDTVYWVRARMRHYTSGVGVWYKAVGLQEWFAINPRLLRNRVGPDGVLNVYIYMFDLPYFNFSRQKAGTH
jgi:hypothetical protein